MGTVVSQRTTSCLDTMMQIYILRKIFYWNELDIAT